MKMERKRLSAILAGVALLLFVMPMHGQNSSLLYYMNIPQNHLLNPAFRPRSAVYFGLPAVTGIEVGVRNNFLSFSDIFHPGASGDSLISILHPDYDINEFIGTLKESNSVKIGTTVQTFGLGFAVGKNGFLFLDINERVEGRISLPGDLVSMILQGNAGFAGKSIDLSSMGGGVTYFREAAISYSTSPIQGLRIGIRPKMLMGIATASINNKDLRIDVGTDFSHSAFADLELNISGPVGIALTADNNIDSIWIEEDFDQVALALGTKNLGFGLDIGASWDINDNFSVSAAILDLGLINWKNSPINLKATSQFTFEGFDLTDVINGTRDFDELSEELLDSLKNSFVVLDERQAFRTYLTPTFVLGGSFSVANSLTLGLVTKSYFLSGSLKTEATISGNANLGNAFSAVVSYSAGSNSYDNLGAGFAVRFGPSQFYLLVDKIPVYWDKVLIQDGPTLYFPNNWNMVNLRVGLNFLFGNKSKRVEDRPMIVQPQTLY